MIIIKSYWDLSFDCHSTLLYLNKFCYLMPVALEKILHIWLKKELFLWSIIVYIGHGFSKYLEKMCIMCPSGNKEIIQENLLFSKTLIAIQKHLHGQVFIFHSFVYHMQSSRSSGIVHVLFVLWSLCWYNITTSMASGSLCCWCIVHTEHAVLYKK